MSREGSAQREAGTRLRDATVEPIVSASLLQRRSTRVFGVTSRREPCSSLRRAAPVSGDATRANQRRRDERHLMLADTFAERRAVTPLRW